MAASGGTDAKEVDANTKFLSHLDPNADIFVAGEQHRIAHAAIARQADHVGDDQRVHAFLLASLVDNAKADFNVWLESKRNV